MTSPVMAIKTLTVKSWPRTCKHCGCSYDIEERDARMAPGVSLVVADTERPFAVARLNACDGEPESTECPCCVKTETFGKLGKGKRKKVELSLLVHPHTGVTIQTTREGGTVPKKSNYACGECGTVHDVLKTVKASGKTGQVAIYAHQGYCPHCDDEGQVYRGRFFVEENNSSLFDAATGSRATGRTRRSAMPRSPPRRSTTPGSPRTRQRSDSSRCSMR
jgi:hypothetical protein